jgi:hypothetical protein
MNRFSIVARLVPALLSVAITSAILAVFQVGYLS